MARTTHVWLLRPAVPTSADDAADWLRAHLADADQVTPTWPILGGLWRWWVRRRGAERVVAHCRDAGRAVLRGEADELLARDLGRVLGPHYRARALAPHELVSAARDVGGSDRVVMIPLCAQVGGRSTIGPLRAGHAALAGHTAARADVAGYPDAADFVDAVAESLATCLLDRPTDAPPYELVFVGLGWHGRPDAYPAQVQASVDAVLRRTGTRRNASLAFVPAPGAARGPDPALADVIAERGAAGARALVFVPIGCSLPTVELHLALGPALRDAARAAGVQHVAVAPYAGTLPSFLHMLASQVRQAEGRANWEVPWRDALVEGVVLGLTPAPPPVEEE
ncbi:MAG: ferrochelatase [Alphaproteobacteria bacterium]|nr:ferrochelatase [Alphaproteobacteria bacterium]